MSDDSEHLTDDELINGLCAWATGSVCAEAAVGLLVWHQLWLRRRDFRREAVWTERSGEHELDADRVVAIDWDAAAKLVDVAPACSSERRVLALAVALAAGCEHPVDLGDALIGLDTSNTTRVLQALAHAAGLHHRHTSVLVDGHIDP